MRKSVVGRFQLHRGKSHISRFPNAHPDWCLHRLYCHCFRHLSGGSWFTLLQNSCTSPGSLTVLINNAIVAGLAPGTYSGTVTVEHPILPGRVPRSLSRSLSLSPPPPHHRQPYVARLQLADWSCGGQSQSGFHSLHHLYAGAHLAALSASVETGSWISVVNPSSGTFSASSPAQITLTLNPNGLAVGTYNGKLTLQTPGGSPTQQDIPVRLIIASAPLLNVPNATLNFAYQLKPVSIKLPKASPSPPPAVP